MPYLRSLRKPSRLFFVLLLVLLTLPAVASASPAADDAGAWTQYRGPARDGHAATDVPLARAWPESGPPELARLEVGSGFSTVVADGDVFYVADSAPRGDDAPEEALTAYRLGQDGAETLWRTPLGDAVVDSFGNGPRATPALHGGMVYTVTSTSRLVALDATTGEIAWQRDLTEFQPAPRFGYATSALVVDDRVLVDVGTKALVDELRAAAEAERETTSATDETGDDGEDSAGSGANDEVQSEIQIEPPPGAVAAFDAATGELRWRGAIPGATAPSSPLLVELGGVRQLVYFRRDGLVGLDLGGELLWRHETGPSTAIAMPVDLGGDVLFVSASDDHFGGKAIRVGRGEDGAWQTEEVWAERLMRNHFNTSVRVGDHLYGFDNTTFKCLDAATGERRWAARGFGKGSLLAAGDLLYVLGDDGRLALVRATPEEYVQLGEVQAMEGRAWTSPSLAAGRLYLRDLDELVVYDVRAAAVEGSAAKAAELARAATTPDLATRRVALEHALSLDVGEILARHAAARGGAEAWDDVRTLRLEGTYSAFSELSDFTLVRSRGPAGGSDLYRLEFENFGRPAVRACDEAGPWMQHMFLGPPVHRPRESADFAGYEPQMLREAHFGPFLLGARARGVEVETIGAGEVNGTPTLDLRVILSSEEGPAAVDGEPAEEIWHLDPATFLEVAVDSQVIDLTQGPGPFRQRAFLSDFRAVEIPGGGRVVLPFQVDLEFNARFESMDVERAEANPVLPEDAFSPPVAPEEAPAAEE